MDKVHIPGGFLIRDPNGRIAPFTCRDYYSAERLVQMSTRGTLTHYEDAKRSQIIRGCDGVRVSPCGS